jgi:hypothetical protein
MKTINIKEFEQTTQLNVETLHTESSNIKISEIMFEKYLLLEISNNNLNCLIDFKGTGDMKVLYLDDFTVIGGTYAINNDAGYIIQTENKFILLSKLNQPQII